jgi:hypothetical protein
LRQIQINQATKTDINAEFSIPIPLNTYIRARAIREIFIIFPATTETSENSIFICDCISASREEFRRLTSVNAHTIAIAMSVIESLYHGRIKAMRKEIIHTQSAIATRSVKIFQIIFSFGTIPLEISLIARVYRPKSAKKAKIHR